MKLKEGQKYELAKDTINSAYAEYIFDQSTENTDGTGTINESAYKTNNASGGELTITKLDTIQRIISGNFWFDAAGADGNKVQVRNGVFDVKY